MTRNPDAKNQQKSGEPALQDATFLSSAEWDAILSSLRFSLREGEIALLIVHNVANPAIAATLGISAHTVHSHLERMYRKLAIGSREQLISRIFQEYVARRLASDERVRLSRAREDAPHTPTP